MMELINLLPDTIFLMATIFSRMSTGNGNSPERFSGRLTFKKLIEGTGICFTEDARGITISSISTGTGEVSIDSLEIAHGTGTGLTSSNFCISQDTGRLGLFGFGSIRSSTSSSYRSCVIVSCNSFIIGGSCNCTSDDLNGVILGGYDNKITNCGNSIIVGGASSLISATSSSIISSKSTLINTESHNSSFISSGGSRTRQMPYSVNISSGYDYEHGTSTGTGNSTKMFTSISTCCTRHNYTDGIGGKILEYSDSVTHNSVISGRRNCFHFQTTKSVITQGTIISSDNSCICSYKVPKTDEREVSKSSTILSSYNSVNSSNFSSVISSNGSILTVNSSPSIATGFSSIISSKGSCIRQTISSSLISTNHSYGPNDFRETMTAIIGSQYSDNRGNLVAIIGGYLNCNRQNFETIIGSENSYSRYRPSVIVGSSFVSAYVIDNANIQGIEGGLVGLSLGGSGNCLHFTSLGGNTNLGFGNSVMIGGKNNKAGLTMQQGLNKLYYREYRYGEQRSVIIGGLSNCSSASNGSVVIGGQLNCELNTINSSIIGGNLNKIYANGCYVRQYFNGPTPYYSSPILNTVENDFIIGGRKNYFGGGISNKFMVNFNKNGPSYIKNSGIISSYNSRIAGITNTYYSRPVYGFNCPGLTSSVILGSKNLANCQSFTLMVSNLCIHGTVKTCKGPTLADLCTGVNGTFTSPSTIVVINGLVIDVT